MKKILSVILAAAAVLSLAACKVKPSQNEETEPYSPDDFQAEMDRLQAERESEYAELLKEQEEINEEIDEYVSKIGKTKKNKELVIEFPYSVGKRYRKFVYNKKGEIDHSIDYYFFDGEEHYKRMLESAENEKHRKVIDKDKKLNMLAIKFDDMDSAPFEDLYDYYSRQDVIEDGYRVIE